MRRTTVIDRNDNPKTTTWIVLGAVAVATGAVIWWRSSRSSPPGAIDPNKVFNYVGAPGYEWPHKDRFPNQVAFGLLLQQLGYDPGDLASPTFSITASQGLNAVAGFQRDYNIVRQNKLAWDFVPAGTKSTGAIDGLLGPKTIEALLNAEQWQQAANLSWAELVDLTQPETS